MAETHERAATLSMTLKADSGYQSSETHRISADQWEGMQKIIHSEVPRRFLHKKTGGTYELVGIGKMQTSDWLVSRLAELPASVDMSPVAIYRADKDGSLWARPLDEFQDGRFAEIPATPEPVAAESN